MRFYFFASTKQINAFKNYFSFLKIENYFWKLKQKSNIFFDTQSLERKNDTIRHLVGPGDSSPPTRHPNYLP